MTPSKNGRLHPKQKVEFEHFSYRLHPNEQWSLSECKLFLGNRFDHAFWFIIQRAAHTCLFFGRFDDFGVDFEKRMSENEIFVMKFLFKMHGEVINGPG